MNQSIFKGVLWNHGEVRLGDKTKYKVVVVGIVLVDEPIGTENSDTIYEGSSFMLQDALQELNERPSKIRVGDALDVLVSLQQL